MNTPPDKPPTRESVESAKRFAASLPALPQARTLENLKQAFDERLAAMSDDDILREFAKSTFSETKPTDYERGFADHADLIKTWMQEQANGILDKATSLLLDGKHDEYADHRQCEWAFRYVIERYNERNQSGLRKAASHV